MRIDLRHFIVLTVICLVLSGCASSLSGSSYSRSDARRVQTVRTGTVINVRQVEIEGTRSGVGAISGGAMGAVLGSFVGAGRGNVLAIVGGGLAGAAAGAAAEEGITRQPGLEITVKMDNGETIAIVQSADERFEPGDTVTVLVQSDGRARVTQ